MEAREIVIVSTVNQSKKVIMSEAETLGQLKADLTAANIDFRDMSFFEGTSKTELLHDSSPLPRDVMYKGQVTNKLVFMLTNSNKKIKSGALTRKEAYEKIQQFGLQNEVRTRFNENYTRVTTAGLEAVIKDYEDSLHEDTPEPTLGACGLVDVVALLLDVLYNDGVISCDDFHHMKEMLSGVHTEAALPYTEEEVEEMFAGIVH